MNETYGAEQNEIYSEEYRSLEYNEIEVNQTVSEYYVAPDNDFTKAVASATTAKKENTLVSSTLLSSSGILAGVTVIVSAVIAMLLMNISVIAYVVTPCSLKVDFSIESGKDVALTAYLTGNGEEYALPIDYSQKECAVYFDFLTPDTDYLLELKDADGNAYYSQVYRTEDYSSDITAEREVYGDGFAVSFDSARFEQGKSYELYVDRNPYAVLDSSVCEAKIEGLLPNTPYKLRLIDSDSGELVYYEELSTGNTFETTTDYINAEGFSLTIDESVMSGYDYALEVYFDNQKTDIVIDKDNPVIVFDGLKASTEYEVALYDPVRQIWPYKTTVQTGDVQVNIENSQTTSDTLTIRYSVFSPTSQNIVLSLMSSDGTTLLQEYDATSQSSPDEYGEASFSGLTAQTNYVLIVWAQDVCVYRGTLETAA